MDSFELNKIIGAILGTLLFVMGVGFVAEAIYHPIEGRGPGYELPEAVAEGDVGPAEPEVVVPIGTLLASANIDQGRQAMSRCQGCHNFEEGAANKQGPGLYNVVGSIIGSHEGYAYSADLDALGDAGETWTYEHLNDFLLAPRGFAPGTKMNFGGLRNPQERANVIAYLSTLSANPVPFPPPEPEPSSEAAVSVEPETIQTPTTVQSDTQVEGTPISGSGPASTEPAGEPTPTEPAADDAAAEAAESPTTEVPETMAPAVESVEPTEGTAAPQ